MFNRLISTYIICYCAVVLLTYRQRKTENLKSLISIVITADKDMEPAADVLPDLQPPSSPAAASSELPGPSSAAAPPGE